MPGVFHARRVVNHQPRGFQLRGHLGKLKLHALKLIDRFAKLLALAGVSNCRVERAARDADHLRADADAAFVQSFNRSLVALADFAQHVLFRHLAVFQNQFGRRRSANAELVFFLADRKPCETLFQR